jgi:2-phospho-L-lactate guanylyltransferase (CobY/MobA/RfbA family)|tara:strand:- start:2343 stop:2639 length:297 start_codon:yes stop_codon:yes gene_type:complete
VKDLSKTYKEPTMTEHEKERFLREMLEDVDKARHVVSAILDNNQISPMTGLIALKTLVRQVSATMDDANLDASDTIVDAIWEDCLKDQMEAMYSGSCH